MFTKLSLAFFLFSVYEVLGQDFFIYHSPDDKKLISIKIDLKEFHRDSSFKVSVPHSTTNPNNETHLWEGISLVSLIKFANKTKIGSKDYVSIIANDNYTIGFNYETIRKEKTFVATLRNGQSIGHKLGEEQIIHPLADEKNPLRSGEWWAWFNKALVIGKIPPVIEISGKALDLRSFKPDIKASALPPYPVGISNALPSKDKVKINCLSMNKVPGFSDKTKSLDIFTLNGNTQKISNPKDYAFCYLWNGKVINPWLGGPTQLCQIDNPTRCFFYIKSVSFNN